jgi:hypothetical protein
MKVTMPEEKYQHFYEGAYPSSNGLSGKWIAEIRIYSGGIQPGINIDYSVARYSGDEPHVAIEGGSPFPWLPAVMGTAGVILLAGSCFFFRRQGIKALQKGSLAALGIILIAISPLLYFHPWQATLP